MLSRILAGFSDVILSFFHLYHNCYFNRMAKQPFYAIELDPYFWKGNGRNPLIHAFSTKFATRKHFKRPFQLRSALH